MGQWKPAIGSESKDGGAEWENVERVQGAPHHVARPEAGWVNGECLFLVAPGNLGMMP